ncbi:MAG: hypothetical protein J6X67_03350, partial [Treponema sp.]|nr:hypothetical protein [Treponema sp.]
MKLWLAIQSRIKSGWQAFFVPESLFPQIDIDVHKQGYFCKAKKRYIWCRIKYLFCIQYPSYLEGKLLIKI